MDKCPHCGSSYRKEDIESLISVCETAKKTFELMNLPSNAEMLKMILDRLEKKDE